MVENLACAAVARSEEQRAKAHQTATRRFRDGRDPKPDSAILGQRAGAVVIRRPHEDLTVIPRAAPHAARPTVHPSYGVIPFKNIPSLVISSVGTRRKRLAKFANFSSEYPFSSARMSRNEFRPTARESFIHQLSRDTGGRGRTDTPLREQDFESSASATFATPAFFQVAETRRRRRRWQAPCARDRCPTARAAHRRAP